MSIKRFICTNLECITKRAIDQRFVTSDPPTCFYCGEEIKEIDITTEAHFVSGPYSGYACPSWPPVSIEEESNK